MDRAIGILLAGGGALTVLAALRRWKGRPALALNLLASALLYCAAAFRAYGMSPASVARGWRVLLSYRQGRVFLAALLLAPWLQSRILGGILRRMGRIREKEAKRRAEALERAQQREQRRQEQAREDLRDSIRELSALEIDVIPFLSAVDAGGRDDPRFSSALAGWKRRARDARERCQRLNRIAGEMDIPERASVFTK